MPEFNIKIVPSQAILLLIAHYNSQPQDNEISEHIQILKKLYLTGAHTTEYKKKLETYFKMPELANFKILSDVQSINNDASRRYFETHLAYETLAQGLDDIEYAELASYYTAAHELLIQSLDKKIISATSSREKTFFENVKLKVERVLNGEYRADEQDLYKQYANYIDKLKPIRDEGDNYRMYGELNDNQRKKIELLTKCAFLGVMSGKYASLPLNIYGQGFYSEDQKGKQMKAGQETARTTHHGLMKNYMPLPLNDIAQGTEVYPYLKPSDQATFVPHAKWVKHNFLRMVHPYSNSISGTMLCQLRLMAHLRNNHLENFTEDPLKMSRFIKLLASSALYNSGGHTLYEFIAPLSLPAVKEEFASTPEFSGINLESMFLNDNDSAFENALDDTIQYNYALIKRQMLSKELKRYLQSKIDINLAVKESLKRKNTIVDETSKENVVPNKRSRDL